MSEPIWVECESVAVVPSADELGGMATIGRCAVLRFASLTNGDRTALIRRLSDALPEHSTFYSGGSEGQLWITVMKVVDRSRVLGRRSEVFRSVEEYRRLCASLVTRYRTGWLSRDWETGEDGGHCRFRNRRTGQVVEAPTGEWVNPDRVDPYFFTVFVRSTGGMEAVAELLADDYHDAARVLEVVAYGPNEFYDPKNVLRRAWSDCRMPSRNLQLCASAMLATICGLVTWGVFTLLTMMMNPAQTGADYWSAVRDRAESNPVLAGTVLLFGAATVFGLGVVVLGLFRRRGGHHFNNSSASAVRIADDGSGVGRA